MKFLLVLLSRLFLLILYFYDKLKPNYSWLSIHMDNSEINPCFVNHMTRAAHLLLYKLSCSD